MNERDEVREVPGRAQHEELAPDEASYLREELDHVPNLTGGLGEFGAGLPVGEARTFFGSRTNVAYRNDLEAMQGTARQFAELVWENGVQGIPPHNLSGRETDIPQAHLIKGGHVETDPIGFLQVEQTDQGLLARVGAIDPVTKGVRSLRL